MIYLFTGDDSKQKFLSYEKFLKSVSKDTEIFYINRNDFNKSQVESLYSGRGLFFTQCLVVFSSVLEYEETRDFVLERLEPMAKSGNSFIFLESKLNKAILDAFKKIPSSSIDIKIFDLPKEKKEKFNNFLLANAFSMKDKLNLWIYFRQAVERGVGLEELVGVLFWKIKDMILKKDFRQFKEVDLKMYASRLSYLLPQARKAGFDAEIVFEQFLLEAF